MTFYIICGIGIAALFLIATIFALVESAQVQS